MRLPALSSSEELQYAPFVAAALCVAVLIGFPLGLTLAVAAARGSDLGGNWVVLAQVHGHLQLAGWFGLFVVGMGYRLVPRFTGARLRRPWPAPATFVLMTLGLALRGVSQTWMDEAPYGVAAVGSGLLELLASVLFASVIWRCLRRGRLDEFGYTPFFAVGAGWLMVAAALNAVFLADAAGDGRAMLVAGRSSAVTSALLYGFITAFILGVSLRTFPVFFGRPPVARAFSRGVLVALTGGVAGQVLGAVWSAQEVSGVSRSLYDVGLLASGLALATVVPVFAILRGSPHRLRESARRSMLFVRAGYAWLLAAGVLQAYYAARALAEGRFVQYYETDAVRHLLALGFATTVLFGMALLVIPRLAIRRVTGRTARAVVVSLLLLIQGAAVTRGSGALLVNELRFEEGFWTMSAGGVAGLLAVIVFAVYLVRDPGKIEIPVAAGPGGDGG